MINRLRHLTPLDRSEGWQERTAGFLIDRFEETLKQLEMDRPVPEWMSGLSVLKTLDNPGILSGALEHEVSLLAHDLEKLR